MSGRKRCQNPLVASTWAVHAPDGVTGGIPLGRHQAVDNVRSQRRNRQETQLANHALELLPLAIAVVDAKLRLHYWNPQAAAFLDVSPLLAQQAPLLTDILEAVDSLSLQQRDRLLEFCSSRIAADDRAEPDTSLGLSLARGNRIQVQLRGLGAGRWMLIIDNRQTMPAGVHDAKDAWLDALTGLSNRRHFSEALKDLISGAGRQPDHALLMINLDRFQESQRHIWLCNR